MTFETDTYVRKSDNMPERVQGMRVPYNIDGVRKVAEWVRSREGYSVPFLSKEGLLIRVHEGGSGVDPYNWWAESGSELMWMPEEIVDQYGYEPEEEYEE